MSSLVCSRHKEGVGKRRWEGRDSLGTYTKRWAVTCEMALSRSSCARLSVRLLTAALDALYAGLPLTPREEDVRKVNEWLRRVKGRTEG
jgi:hypothetical protein